MSQTLTKMYLKELNTSQRLEVSKELRTNVAFNIQLEQCLNNMSNLLVDIIRGREEFMIKDIDHFFDTLPYMHPLTKKMYQFYGKEEAIQNLIGCSNQEIKYKREDLNFLREKIQEAFAAIPIQKNTQRHLH